MSDVHGLLADDPGISWEEDAVDEKNDLTFGDGAIEGDWRANHKKLANMLEGAAEQPPQERLVQSIENLVVKSKNDYDDPAIVSLQKIPSMGAGYPGFTNTSQIPADIWATPSPVQPPPPPSNAAPGPPPGLRAPPGFGGMVSAAPDQGDGLNMLDPGTMPLSVDDLERQHLERQQLAQMQAQQQQQQHRYENGIVNPIGTKPHINNDGIDDPAVLATRIVEPQPQQQQQQQQHREHNVHQLHPQHQRMLQNNRRNNRRQNNQRKQRDPYANLMSKREREWITSMQLRALEVKDPEVDDYYYVNYMKRLLKKGMNTENHLVTPAPKETRRNRKNSESQGKENKENKENGEKKEGEVSGQPKKAWSEGSLGKPISSSVHNPRRMIAMLKNTAKEAEESQAPSDENTETELAKYMSRAKLFKSIEAAYTILLDLELMVQEELRSFGKEAKKVEELLQLIQPSDQMRLLSILSIRKGKRLIQRTLPHLMNQEASIQILNCFINNLSLITKRDMEDDVLPELYDVLANILNALDFEQVADLASRKRYNALQNVAKSRFGASIICKLLDRGQVSLSQLSIQEFPADARQAWLDLVKTLTRDIAACALSAEGLPPLLGVYPALAKAFERSRSQRHLINHLNGNYYKTKAPHNAAQNNYAY